MLNDDTVLMKQNKLAELTKRLLQDGFDGVIIGTAIMKKLNASVEELMTFLKNMETAIEEV